MNKLADPHGYEALITAAVASFFTEETQLIEIRSPATVRRELLAVLGGRSVPASLVADYRSVFGKKPGKIASVALLADTDDAGLETTRVVRQHRAKLAT